MSGYTRVLAALLTSSLFAAALAPQPANAAGPTIQRLKGTVGFAAVADGSRTDVVTTSDMPNSAETFAGCSSQAALSLTDGAQVQIGGRTDFVTPPGSSGPGMLRSGALQFDLAGRPALPLIVDTKYGTFFVAHGSGYVVAGGSGVQIIVRKSEINDVMFVANGKISVVPSGQSLVADIAGNARILSLPAVNNTAIYQFNGGRNPLGTDGTAVAGDPTGSPDYDCSAVVAGLGGGAIAALLGLGAAGAIAIGVGHGGGGSGPTSTPGGGATATPTGGATATPTAGGATPTPTASGSTPTPTPTPTQIATSTPTPGGPTPSPTPSGATPTPTASPTPALGPVVLNPSSTLLSPGIGAPATVTFTASQLNFTGAFTISQPSCPVSLLGTPTASISGDTITFSLPSQIAALSLFCTVTVFGGGGKSATESIAIVISAVGPSPSPTPTPTPTAVGATPTPTPTPTAVGATPTPSPTPALGPVVLNPTSTLLSPGIGAPATAIFTASQMNYTGAFTISQPTCPLSLLGTPTASISGDTITFSLPSQVAALSLFCTVTVLGGGGKSATEPIAIVISALGPSPTPSPTPSGAKPTPTPTAGGATPSPTPSGATPTPSPTPALGPVVLNPTSTLLSTGVGSPSTTIFTASQLNYTGAFTISQPSCPVSLLGTPTASISGDTITFSLPSQIAAASLFCTVTVFGGGGKSATEPIAIVISALGPSPTPSPTPSGAAPTPTPIGATPTPSPTPGLGPVVLIPSSTLLSPGIGSPATVTFTASQLNFTGAFTISQPSCPVSLLGTPTASISGDTITFSLPSQIAAVSLFCTVTVLGGGGKTATESIAIVISALGPSPTPSPTPSGATPTPSPSTTPTGVGGPLTASPGSVLLNVSATAPATQNILVSPSAEGPFTATTVCVLPLLGVPTTSVAGNVVTITAPAQVLTAPVGCSTVITSTSTGQSVTVPIIVSATVLGPASPPPTPNPTGVGPLYAVPGSITLNPGVTTSAVQNIAIFDHGFTGTYKASLTAGCLALQAPVVTLSDGNIATITVPGQLVNVALLCSVTISDGTQTIEVPVTISATVLGGAARKSQFDGIAFRPPVLALEGAGSEESVELIGRHAPYSASAVCPAGDSLETTIEGTRAVVKATTIAADATCMLTITGSSGTFGQVPVRIAANRFAPPIDRLLPGSRSALQTNAAIVLHTGEERILPLAGGAPFVLSGSCSRVADATLDGFILRLTAHAPGSCTLTVHEASGTVQTFSIAVRADSEPPSRK